MRALKAFRTVVVFATVLAVLVVASAVITATVHKALASGAILAMGR